MKYLSSFKIFEGKKVTCECGWEWNLEEGGKDPYTCHKCGKVNEKMEWTKFFKILSFKYSFFENDYRIITEKDPEFNDCIYDCILSKYEKDIVEIYSIKRLSDGEIFTVGDQLLLGGEDYAKIDKIWPSFEQMRADSGRLGLVLNNKFLTVKKNKQKGKIKI
jgi:hypothetical protein